MRYDLKPAKLAFWAILNIAVWGLLYAAYPAARRAVYVGYEMVVELSLHHRPSQIMANIGEVASRADASSAAAGSLPWIFALAPIVMALTMFIAPLVVRRDNRRPIRGVILLPFMTLLCYLITMLMNIVAGSLVQMGLHWYLGTTPGPDFFVYMVQPLFIFMPFAMGSAAGTISQICYMLYILSVLAMRASRVRDADAKPKETAAEEPPRRRARSDDGGEAGGDLAAACDMEADRLCRLVAKRFGDVSLAHDVRCDIQAHISSAAGLRDDMSHGYEPYRIVLLEAAKSLRKAIDSDPASVSAGCSFEYIVGEMERMSYCTASDARALKGWLAVKKKGAGAS